MSQTPTPANPPSPFHERESTGPVSLVGERVSGQWRTISEESAKARLWEALASWAKGRKAVVAVGSAALVVASFGALYTACRVDKAVDRAVNAVVAPAAAEHHAKEHKPIIDEQAACKERSRVLTEKVGKIEGHLSEMRGTLGGMRESLETIRSVLVTRPRSPR